MYIHAYIHAQMYMYTYLLNIQYNHALFIYGMYA